MTHIRGAAFRLSAADTALAYTQARPTPMGVVLVPDDRPYGHYWVVSVADADLLERRGYKVVDAGT
jgi:hypothetical protein